MPPAVNIVICSEREVDQAADVVRVIAVQPGEFGERLPVVAGGDPERGPQRKRSVARVSRVSRISHARPAAAGAGSGPRASRP